MVESAARLHPSEGPRPRGEYEEYHPYGTTAWWAEKSGIQVSQKRYRYTGMEKDDETALAYHSARYYAPWLGRWERPDPAGLVDGVNRFAYARGNPIGLSDSSGHSGNPTEPTDDESAQQASPKELRAAAAEDAARTTAETGQPLMTQHPFAQLPAEVVDAALSVSKSLGGRVSPAEVLALWVQEGGRVVRPLETQGETIWAYGEADASNIARSLLLFSGHGLDQFTYYVPKTDDKGRPIGENRLVTEPLSGGFHHRAFDAAAERYIARGLLPADYRQRVDSAVQLREQVPPRDAQGNAYWPRQGQRQYHVTAAPEFLELTMMGQAAVDIVQRDRAARALPGASPNDIQAMGYVGFNIPGRIGEVAAYGGSGTDIATWAFHSQIDDTLKVADSRRKGVNFAFLVRSYERMY